MKNIKHIAGDILLYFYSLQRKNGFPAHSILSFSGVYGGVVTLDADDQISKDLLLLSEGNSADVYNALHYLEEASFLDFNYSKTTADHSMHGFHVAARGIDIIEGIERGEEERNVFNINFNIKLADNVNVDALVKAELGGLLSGLIG